MKQYLLPEKGQFYKANLHRHTVVSDGTLTPEEVKQDLEGMQVMRNLGNQMAWLLKCIEAGKEKGIERPGIVFKDRTNFIR